MLKSSQSDWISNYRVRITQWAGAFANDQTLTAVMLDWLLHHAHIVQMIVERSRFKDKCKAGTKPSRAQNPDGTFRKREELKNSLKDTGFQSSQACVTKQLKIPKPPRALPKTSVSAP